ncbi:MAG TPA: MerR family transcriptional regulator [Steroidobacteraceae bacterium]|nr:MerR family transcriptional regulator [Steroidobacteraceae bacterium]
MGKPELQERLTAAECANRTGLTVRALRVYEEYGLIAPRRSAAGWRQYGAEDLVKLNTIALLKSAGLSLTQIRDVTRSSPETPSLQRILQIQLATWRTRLEDAERGRAITQAALARLNSQHPLSVDELCNVIRSFEMTQTPSASSPTSTSEEKDAEDVIIEPAVLDRYVGYYASHKGEFGFYTLTRDETKLIMQITGQPPVDLYPVGEGEFSVKVVDAQITFIEGGEGQATGLVLRQGGVEIRAERIDAATAEGLRVKLAFRIEQKTPTQGSEEALRRLIAGTRAGTPNYEEMSPAFAQVVQRQLSRLQPMSSYLGDIQSIEFLGVGSAGWDVYDVRREQGSQRWRIAVGSDGKIQGAIVVLTSPMPVSLGP